jgi:hypothetical protein
MLGQFIMSGHIVHWLGEVKPHLCKGQHFASFFRILRFIRPSQIIECPLAVLQPQRRWTSLTKASHCWFSL